MENVTVTSINIIHIYLFLNKLNTSSFLKPLIKYVINKLLSRYVIVITILKSNISTTLFVGYMIVSIRRNYTYYGFRLK